MSIEILSNTKAAIKPRSRTQLRAILRLRNEVEAPETGTKRVNASPMAVDAAKELHRAFATAERRIGSKSTGYVMQNAAKRHHRQKTDSRSSGICAVRQRERSRRRSQIVNPTILLIHSKNKPAVSLEGNPKLRDSGNGKRIHNQSYGSGCPTQRKFPHRALRDLAIRSPPRILRYITLSDLQS